MLSGRDADSSFNSRQPYQAQYQGIMGKEAEVIKFKLNNRSELPAIGMGTASSADEEEAKDGVLTALKIGYRHIDTAAMYGSEGSVGEALQEAFDSGVVKREELHVTTKLWCDSMDPKDVLPAFKKSLSRLHLDYVDLYLIHWPFHLRKGAEWWNLKEDDFLPLDIKGVWQELEHLAELGLTKGIGVSNFSVKRLQELLPHARIVPAVNQVEMHPLWQQAKLKAYCDKKGIHLTAWSPLGAVEKGYGGADVIDHPVLTDIGSKYGKTAAQVSLRWLAERGASAVPKSYSEQRATQNISIFDFSLTDEDHQRISTMEQHKYGENDSIYNGPWKTFEDFWDDNE